jgi:predicted Fe-S protein YdhL (DUF1289 family)
MRALKLAKFSSFDEADRAERAEYRAMSPQERLEIVSQLRALLHGPDDASAPRLERVLTLTQLSRS